MLVDGKETGVRYWQCDIKNVIQQYQLKFPDGLKRTYIYSHLPKNFRMNSMLAGLCNLCDDFGHSNFESLKLLLDDLKKAGMINAAAHSEIVSASRQYQKYLKVEFPKEVSSKLTNKKCTMVIIWKNAESAIRDGCDEFSRVLCIPFLKNALVLWACMQ